MLRVLIDRESLSAALADRLATVPEAKDRALIQALAYGVSRWFWELDFLLARLCAKPIKEPYVKALALIGLFQLRHMRVKPYAAVAETVAAAKRMSWAKPLLNGLLRTYQREQASLETAVAANE
jgi:16S rRNA (cytosine967-C5)-methyltransferase